MSGADGSADAVAEVKGRETHSRLRGNRCRPKPPPYPLDAVGPSVVQWEHSVVRAAVAQADSLRRCSAAESRPFGVTSPPEMRKGRYGIPRDARSRKGWTSPVRRQRNGQASTTAASSSGGMAKRSRTTRGPFRSQSRISPPSLCERPSPVILNGNSIDKR